MLRSTHAAMGAWEAELSLRAVNRRQAASGLGSLPRTDEGCECEEGEVLDPAVLELLRDAGPHANGRRRDARRE